MSKRVIITKLFVGLIACLLGSLIALISSFNSDFFGQMLINLTDNSFWFFYFIGIVLIITTLYNFFHNENIILRNNNFEKYINNNIINIIKINILLFLIVLIFLVVGSLIITDFNIDINSKIVYQFPAYLYCLFFSIRSLLIITMLSIIIYVLYWNFGKKITMIFWGACLCLFFISFPHNDVINKISEIPLLFIRYFKILPYTSFSLEIIATISQFVILLLILSIFYYLLIEKSKRDKIL